MIRRSTWIILSVFIVVAGAAAAQKWYQSTHIEVTPTATAEPTAAPVFASTTANINALRMESAEGKLLVFSLNADGWAVLEPQGSAITASEIESAVSALQSWEVYDQLASSPSAASIGLDAPAYTIQITMDDGTSHTVAIGDETATGAGYYTQIDADSPIIIAASSVNSVVTLFTIEPTPMPTSESSGTQPATTVTTTP